MCPISTLTRNSSFSWRVRSCTEGIPTLRMKSSARPRWISLPRTTRRKPRISTHRRVFPLPQGWRGRLVNLPPGDTEGVLDYVWIRRILRSPSTARREKKIFSSTVSSLGGGSWIARNCCGYYSSPLLMSKPGRELRKPSRWISAVRKPNNASTQGSAFDQRQSRERGREDARRPIPRGRGKACDRYSARAAVGHRTWGFTGGVSFQGA